MSFQWYLIMSDTLCLMMMVHHWKMSLNYAFMILFEAHCLLWVPPRSWADHLDSGGCRVRAMFAGDPNSTGHSFENQNPFGRPKNMGRDGSKMTTKICPTATQKTINLRRFSTLLNLHWPLAIQHSEHCHENDPLICTVHDVPLTHGRFRWQTVTLPDGIYIYCINLPWVFHHISISSPLSHHIFVCRNLPYPYIYI